MDDPTHSATSSSPTLTPAALHACRDVLQLLRSASSLTNEFTDSLSLYLKDREASDPEILTLRSLQRTLALLLPPLPAPLSPPTAEEEASRSPVDRVLQDPDLLALILARLVEGKKASMVSRKALGECALVARGWKDVAWRDVFWADICKGAMPLLLMDRAEEKEGGAGLGNMTHLPKHEVLRRHGVAVAGGGRRLLRGHWADEMSVCFEVFEKETGRRLYTGVGPVNLYSREDPEDPDGDMNIDLHVWSGQSKECIGGSFSVAQYDDYNPEGGGARRRVGGRTRGKNRGRKPLKNIKEFFTKRPKIKHEAGEREGGGGGGGGLGYSQDDLASYASFEDEDEDMGQGEGGGSGSSRSSGSSSDDSSDEDSAAYDDEDEGELEENIPPGMAANVSSKPKRWPCMAAQKWTFRATIRCERTGKWALLWESDTATTFYTEQPDESWQLYLPQGSLSVLSNWHSLYTTHASMLNVEAGATFYVQPTLLCGDEEGEKDDREKEWEFATVKKEECGEYAVSFVGLSFKAPDIYFLGQFIRSLLD